MHRILVALVVSMALTANFAEAGEFQRRMEPPKTTKERLELRRAEVEWVKSVFEGLKTPLVKEDDFYAHVCAALQRYEDVNTAMWRVLDFPPRPYRPLIRWQEVGVDSEATAFELRRKAGAQALRALWGVFDRPIPERAMRSCGEGKASFNFADTRSLTKRFWLLRDSYPAALPFYAGIIYSTVAGDYKTRFALIKERMAAAASQAERDSLRVELHVVAEDVVRDGIEPQEVGLALNELPPKALALYQAQRRGGK